MIGSIWGSRVSHCEQPPLSFLLRADCTGLQLVHQSEDEVFEEGRVIVVEEPIDEVVVYFEAHFLEDFRCVTAAYF